MIKIYSADWHIRFVNPRMRTDNYPFVQYQKIEWLCELANKNDAALFVAGDIFDKPVCPIPYLNLYIKLLKTVERGVYSIYGQHDIHFHNSKLDRTPYGVLLAAGALIPASRHMDVCNFGEAVPDEATDLTLMAHIPVTQYAPPFFMEDAISAADFLEQNEQWKYIVTGDFHEQHVTEIGERILFNPGPIMRADKGKMGFQPKVIIHDTNSGDWEWIDIPIEQDVFNLDVADADSRKDYKDKMREYASGLDVDGAKPNFMENMRMVIKQRKPSKEVLGIIDNIMEEIA